MGLGHVVECLSQQETPKDMGHIMLALWHSRLSERAKGGLVVVGMGLGALEGVCPGVRLRFLGWDCLDFSLVRPQVGSKMSLGAQAPELMSAKLKDHIECHRV